MVKLAPSLIVAALTIASSSSLAAPTPTTAPEPEVPSVSVDGTEVEGRKNKEDNEGLVLAAELLDKREKIPTIARSLPKLPTRPSASDNMRRSIPLFASGSDLHQQRGSLSKRGDLVTGLGLAGALAPLGLGGVMGTVEGIVDGLPVVGGPVGGLVSTVDNTVGISSLLDPVAAPDAATDAAPPTKRQVNLPDPLASVLGNLNSTPNPLAQLAALEAELSSLGLSGALPNLPALSSVLGLTRAAYTQPQQDTSAVSGLIGGLPIGSLGGLPVGALGGLPGALTGTLGGATGGLGGLTGGLGGVTGGLGGLTGGLPGVTGTLGGVTGGLGGVTGTLGGATGMLGGVAGTAGGVVGTVQGAAGSLPVVGGTLGGIAGTLGGVSGGAPNPFSTLSVAQAEAAGLLPAGTTSALAAQLNGLGNSFAVNGFHHRNDTIPVDAPAPLNGTAPDAPDAPITPPAPFPYATGAPNVKLPGQFVVSSSAAASTATSDVPIITASAAPSSTVSSAPASTATGVMSPVTDSESEYSDYSDEEDEATAPVLAVEAPTSTGWASRPGWKVQSSSTMAPTPSSAAATAEAMSMTASEAGATAVPTTTGAQRRSNAYVD